MGPDVIPLENVNSRLNRGAIAAILLVGSALRIWQYAANTSMWLDEIAIARSIVGMPLWTLLTVPLPFGQVVPKGFLLAEKIAVLAMGPSDLVLRLVPLVCALVSLFVFWRIAARALTGAGPLVAVAMFATAVPFILFGSLVKQYSIDVFAAVVLTWLAIELVSQTASPHRGWYVGIAGAVLVWFSQPAVLVVAGLGAGVILLSRSTRRGGFAELRAVAPALTLWGLSAAAATLAAKASLTPRVGGFMTAGWAEGFPPLTLAALTETFWPLDRLKLLFGSGNHASLCYPLPMLYVALTGAGFVALWKGNRRFALLLMGPLFVTFGAAVARQYSFSDRLILYLVPSFLIAFAAFVEWARQRASLISPLLGWVSVVVLVAPTIYPVAAVPPPYRIEDMKPVLAYVQARRQPGDAMYIYYGAAQAVTFYGPRYGITNSAYSLGRSYRRHSRCYLEDLDTYRSRSRVWILMTHALYAYQERDDILGYLDTIGVRRDSFTVVSRAVGRNPTPAEAFLYDLSDARRAASATAASFVLANTWPDNPIECNPGRSRMMSLSEFQQRQSIP